MPYTFTYTMQKVARVSEWLLRVINKVPGKPCSGWKDTAGKLLSSALKVPLIIKRLQPHLHIF
jgi:hypothetical protein